MEPIVIYYSQKGNNKYIAEKISKTLRCPIEEIKPRVSQFFFVLMGMQFGIKPLKHKIEDYNTVILCGPIFMGKFIAPLRSFVKQYLHKINSLVFVTCCGSPDEKKFDKFGHGLVFKELETMLKSKCAFCEAMPVDLVLAADKKNDPKIIMNTRLSDDNFKGEIQQRFDAFISKLLSMPA